MERPGREYLASITTKPITAQDLHVINVYDDPEFLREVKVANSSQELNDLASKYAITLADLRHYLNGFEQTNLVRKATKHFDIQPDIKGNWQAWISGDITKAEFDEMWAEINRIKKRRLGKTPKPKLPKHDKLLYAIFKQRQLQPPTTFTAIHTMYDKDELPYYQKDKNGKDLFLEPKKLEEYYRTYKPSPIPPI